jgi:prepilin-type N-terminal cleavage/methylation domain-containing protein
VGYPAGDQGLQTHSEDQGKDCARSLRPLATHPVSRARWSPEGFTLIEMIIVLFLLAAALAIVIPRIVVGADLSAAGRKFIEAIRSLQGLAAAVQKPVRLYLDLDQGTYWAMVLEGKEEKAPLDAAWAAPRTLPASIRFTDIAMGQTKRVSGRIDLSFFPSGRIDPVVVHLADGNNNVLAIAVEPVTGEIRTSDERIEPPRNQTIPDRVKPLLQAATAQGGAGVPPPLRF